MADETNPFASMGSAVRRFWGPSEDERILDRKLGAVKEKGAADQARLQELGQVWAQMVEDFGGDENLALKKFITSPEFFRLGGDDVQTMLKTFKEITAPPKPHVVGEGGALVDPEGRELYKSRKTFEPQKPQIVGEGAAVLMPGDSELTLKNPRTFGPQVVGEGAAIVEPGATEPRYKNFKPLPLLDEAEKIDRKAQAEHGTKIMAKIYDDAQQAQLDRPRFEQLRAVVERNPGGIGTWLRGYLAEKGIPVQGKTDLDLWTAMLNQAAPRTREPGSGVFTDKDFDAAIKGLPNMLKSKDANKLIADMALDLIDYRIGRGGAAAGYLSGDITRKQAFDDINKVQVKRRAPKGRRRYNPDTGEFE